jgi:hypothetical protein
LFTTIEMQKNPTQGNQSSLVPATDTPQYLGDLEDNSPLPFSIPLAIGIADNNSSSSLAPGNYPVSLKIIYSDELRNTHEVILNRTVSYSPPQQEEAPDQGFLGFGSSTTENRTTGSILPLLLIFAAIVAAAVVVIIIVIRRRSRTKKISRIMTGREDDNDVFEAFKDEEHLDSSRKEESSDKQ